MQACTNESASRSVLSVALETFDLRQSLTTYLRHGFLFRGIPGTYRPRFNESSQPLFDIIHLNFFSRSRRPTAKAFAWATWYSVNSPT
jgi:hypothetical protein